MRTATALRSMSGVDRSGYEPPLFWKVVSEVQAADTQAVGTLVASPLLGIRLLGVVRLVAGHLFHHMGTAAGQAPL